VRRGRLGFWYRLAIVIVQPLLYIFTRRDWRGRENIPRKGGLIIAINHLSHVDPFTLAHYLYRSGRPPRYLAKSELWSIPFVKWVVAGAGQIPVHRRTRDAALALKDAVAAVERGECLVIYPEGSTTKDPAYWPMVPKTGVARLALMTGAPVVPMGQWGAQEIYGQDRKLHLLPPKRIHMAAAPAVDLSAYRGKPMTLQVLHDATDVIMSEVRRLVGELREEEPPAVAFDPKTAKVTDAHATRDERRSA
jgi:1-acyl-sn-glycerol-3-phosphate acyltransferase